MKTRGILHWTGQRDTLTDILCKGVSLPHKRNSNVTVLATEYSVLAAHINDPLKAVRQNQPSH